MSMLNLLPEPGPWSWTCPFCREFLGGISTHSEAVTITQGHLEMHEGIEPA